jgi:UDP-N-acetyl-D-galactosamine dehydrogenase
VAVHDPLADAAEAAREYGVALTAWEELPRDCDALVVAVAHAAYREMPPAQLLACLRPGGCVIDVKSVVANPLGRPVWRL